MEDHSGGEKATVEAFPKYEDHLSDLQSSQLNEISDNRSSITDFNNHPDSDDVALTDSDSESNSSREEGVFYYDEIRKAFLIPQQEVAQVWEAKDFADFTKWKYEDQELAFNSLKILITNVAANFNVHMRELFYKENGQWDGSQENLSDLRGELNIKDVKMMAFQYAINALKKKYENLRLLYEMINKNSQVGSLQEKLNNLQADFTELKLKHEEHMEDCNLLRISVYDLEVAEERKRMESRDHRAAFKFLQDAICALDRVNENKINSLYHQVNSLQEQLKFSDLKVKEAQFDTQFDALRQQVDDNLQQASIKFELFERKIVDLKEKLADNTKAVENLQYKALDPANPPMFVGNNEPTFGGWKLLWRTWQSKNESRPHPNDFTSILSGPALELVELYLSTHNVPSERHNLMVMAFLEVVYGTPDLTSKAGKALHEMSRKLAGISEDEDWAKFL